MPGTALTALREFYSDAEEAKKGGDWGWVKRDELRKDLSAPAFNLKAGAPLAASSTPPDGYYSCKLTM